MLSFCYKWPTSWTTFFVSRNWWKRFVFFCSLNNLFLNLEFKPLIRLFAIDSTESLVAIQNWTIELSKTGSSINKLRHSAKNRRRQTIQIGQQQNPQQQQMIHSSQYQTITFIGNDLYAIRKETEILSSSSSSSQLFLVKLDINQVDQVIYKVVNKYFPESL